MRRNCNLELRLFPSQDDAGYNHPIIMGGEGNNNNESSEMMMSAEDEGQQQKLTIFYDGKVCASDVTDVQARWIMKEASKKWRRK
ncbi:protein TIFY 5A-like [Neltuma alba]|uniref:protein TIFY 5A-like n=1 Tax=Neltuma alba TaxID=207710 RepID=UPI0010A430C5|nr:protein TIFY 5A-like [Prosopis alba]